MYFKEMSCVTETNNFQEEWDSVFLFDIVKHNFFSHFKFLVVHLYEM